MPQRSPELARARRLRERSRWARAVLRNVDPAPALRRLIAVDRRLGARGILGRARPLDRAAVRHLALEARVYADGMRRGYLAAHVILRNGDWGGKFVHTRAAAVRRWWSRWVQHLDREWVEDAELGHVAAAWIGLALEEGDVEPEDTLRSRTATDQWAIAHEYYELAAPQDNAFALSQIGFHLRYYRRGRSNAKLRRAAQCLERAAGRGNVDAMWELGYCLMYGEGVRKDYHRAARLYRRAARAGDYSAMFNLGLCYKHGHGVPRSLDRAVALWLAAARRGCDRSLEHLAEVFATGPEHLRDPRRARYYARRDAADKARRRKLRSGA